jgi:hypothetical protein
MWIPIALRAVPKGAGVTRAPCAAHRSGTLRTLRSRQVDANRQKCIDALAGRDLGIKRDEVHAQMIHVAVALAPATSGRRLLSALCKFAAAVSAFAGKLTFICDSCRCKERRHGHGES